MSVYTQFCIVRLEVFQQNSADFLSGGYTRGEASDATSAAAYYLSVASGIAAPPLQGSSPLIYRDIYSFIDELFLKILELNLEIFT